MLESQEFFLCGLGIGGVFDSGGVFDRLPWVPDFSAEFFLAKPGR